jgi:molecular chaperone GrpE
VSKRKSQPENTVEPTEAPETEDPIELLTAQVEEAVEARKRALADFANYQRRAAENECRALETGAAGVVRSLLGVLDHIDLALDQDTEQITVEQLLSGVSIARDELIKALKSHGVKRICPEPGDEMDPNRHQAMMRVPAEGIEENHIVGVMQPGYLMGELVLRPAKVSVAAPLDDGS